MLNRRLIRIKVFKALYSFENSGEGSADRALNRLMESCEKTRDLYCFLLNVTGSLARVANERINAGLRKFHPSEEESNPSFRFVENRLTAIVNSDSDFGKICLKKGLVWHEYDVFLKKVYNSILSSDYYREYMSAPESSMESDCRFWTAVFENEFEDNEMLENILEEKYVDWVDELAFVLNLIIGDIRRIAASGRVPELKVFQKPDDQEFARLLLLESINNWKECNNAIFDNSDNWDSDRVVSTDVALIVMGISEAVTFPTIPVKVTINEYVELSKFYSTPNSRIFVNGVLNKVIQDKIADGEITKTGRGLQE